MINTNEVCDSLIKNGWYSGSNIFDRNFVQEAVKEFNSKDLKEAGIGATAIRQESIRNDEIYWFEPEHNSVIENKYIEAINRLKSSLNESLYLGLNGHEVHYAKYEKGGFYKPHLDNVKGKNNRVLTIITYLNENWKKEDGGVLKLHLENEVKEIEPKAGNVVIFLSEKVLHEVAPSNKTRQSLTGWLLHK